jgi:hypothetical protein
MNDSSSGKQWEVSLGPEPSVHVHYATASPQVISDGFEGLARELREIADQLEAIARRVNPKCSSYQVPALIVASL